MANICSKQRSAHLDEERIVDASGKSSDFVVSELLVIPIAVADAPHLEAASELERASHAPRRALSTAPHALPPGCGREKTSHVVASPEVTHRYNVHC